VAITSISSELLGQLTQDPFALVRQLDLVAISKREQPPEIRIANGGRNDKRVDCRIYDVGPGNRWRQEIGHKRRAEEDSITDEELEVRGQLANGVGQTPRRIHALCRDWP
jgi:hypothetical protein